MDYVAEASMELLVEILICHCLEALEILFSDGDVFVLVAKKPRTRSSPFDDHLAYRAID
jgi:hypothetical protein